MTRDFGRFALGSARLGTLREDQTVMRLLRSEFEVETRFGGRFVQAIDGLEGSGPAGMRDWFFFVNGVESETVMRLHAIARRELVLGRTGGRRQPAKVMRSIGSRA